MVFHLPKGKRKIAVIAGIIGNIMEWYDFALYGFMPSVISKLFFPEGNPFASLLATYAIFAAGFICGLWVRLFSDGLGTLSTKQDHADKRDSHDLTHLSPRGPTYPLTRSSASGRLSALS